MLLRPDVALRLEALLAFALSLVVYASNFPHQWLLFTALILVPDLSLLGYATRNLRVAAFLYNLVHTLVLPLALSSVGLLFARPLVIQISLIWAAHIFFDRLLGYGLKFPNAFKPTHLQSAAIFPADRTSEYATASFPS